jgi:hypothetical protein
MLLAMKNAVAIHVIEFGKVAQLQMELVLIHAARE